MRPLSHDRRPGGRPGAHRQQRHHDDHHQRDRQRGAQRPVAALAELQLDQVADHHVLAAAQHARRHIGAERGDEDQDRAGDDARLDQRNDDAPQHLQAVGVEIVAGLDQAEIELLHAGIERQHHQRQVDIDHAQHDREVGVHHLDRLLDDAEPISRRVDDAFIADDFLTAKVRMSRLVQNGMVIRNSQSRGCAPAAWR